MLGARVRLKLLLAVGLEGAALARIFGLAEVLIFAVQDQLVVIAGGVGAGGALEGFGARSRCDDRRGRLCQKQHNVRKLYFYTGI